MRLSLVIPCYNEEKGITRVIKGLVHNLEMAAIDYELVLVNNGSVDGSPGILEELARQKPGRIRVVHVLVNQGYGWGIINGLGATIGEYVGFMCGDGQIKPEDVVAVYRRIEQGSCDLAKVKRVSREDGWRRIISLAYNCLFRVFFGVASLDVNGTPKILSRKWLTRLELVAKDWFIDAELMIKAKHLNLRVAEVPVESSRREGGRSHVGLTTVLEFARNMLNYRIGKGMRAWKQEMPRL